jgi:hypothetical protein
LAVVHSSEWAHHGIKFVPCERTTSENYLAALPVFLARRVRLVDNAVLRSQLAGLERRVHSGDRESVSHAASANAHDDVACSACGAIVIAASRPTYNLWAAFPNEEMDPAVARLFGREQSQAEARDERYRRGLAVHIFNCTGHWPR